MTCRWLRRSLLVNGLSRVPGRIVIDRTGLTGNWDATLTPRTHN
jgi:uncharacterized protein (TIGR03435 family)